ncbi:hypothetical protein CISIN_1g038141mg [Citrus sinensis]|uniref:Uncharacterized protein n=1 Tax=Citrus sinensis TaxID=2711 RepID=A0A067D0X6_CITSI|nr:hypothetical protein CISIN_1g038141mg [Citrus sinensis]
MKHAELDFPFNLNKSATTSPHDACRQHLGPDRGPLPNANKDVTTKQLIVSIDAQLITLHPEHLLDKASYDYGEIGEDQAFEST